MHESAQGCMRVHFHHGRALGRTRVHCCDVSALGYMRVHLDHGSALGWMRVHFHPSKHTRMYDTALGSWECTGMHERALW